MNIFQIVTSVAIPLYRPNIDTDTIIPSRHIKSVSREGLGAGAFAAWRYLPAGDEASGVRRKNPDFVLNRPAFASAAVLLGGENFGCGSSREAAVWALQQIGIRCVIAPSFGTIFKANCLANGLLALELPEDVARGLAERADDGSLMLTVDLFGCTVVAASGESWPFDIDADVRRRLLEGLDEIGLTLTHADAIAAFQAADREKRPWIWLERNGSR